jgi:hypothetical protein
MATHAFLLSIYKNYSPCPQAKDTGYGSNNPFKVTFTWWLIFISTRERTKKKEQRPVVVVARKAGHEHIPSEHGTASPEYCADS